MRFGDSYPAPPPPAPLPRPLPYIPLLRDRYFNPLAPSAFHNRYVWLLFLQSSTVTPSPLDLASWTTDPIVGRTLVNVQSMAGTYGLGAPVGINWQRQAADAWVVSAWATLLAGSLSTDARALLASFNPQNTSCNTVYPVKVSPAVATAGGVACTACPPPPHLLAPTPLAASVSVPQRLVTPTLHPSHPALIALPPPPTSATHSHCSVWQTLQFSLMGTDPKCPVNYQTIFPLCQTSYHCVDVSTGTVQGTSGFYIMFQGSFNAATGVAVVDWVDGYRGAGRMTWTYSANYTSITGALSSGAGVTSAGCVLVACLGRIGCTWSGTRGHSPTLTASRLVSLHTMPVAADAPFPVACLILAEAVARGHCMDRTIPPFTPTPAHTPTLVEQLELPFRCGSGVRSDVCAPVVGVYRRNCRGGGAGKVHGDCVLARWIPARPVLVHHH